MDLSNMLGGAGGVDVGRLTTAVQDVFQSKGGVEGLTNQLRAGGLGGAVDSWISTGPNQSVEPQQLGQALGPDTVNQLAQQVGHRRDDAAPAARVAAAADHRLPHARRAAAGGRRRRIHGRDRRRDRQRAAAGGAGGLGGLAGSLGGLLGGSDQKDADALLEQALRRRARSARPSGRTARRSGGGRHGRPASGRPQPPTRCRRCRRTRSRAPRRARAGSSLFSTMPARALVGARRSPRLRGDGVVRRRDDEHAVRGHLPEDRVEDGGRVGTERRRRHALDDVVDADEERDEVRAQRHELRDLALEHVARRPAVDGEVLDELEAARTQGLDEPVRPAIRVADRRPDRVRVAQRDVAQGRRRTRSASR